MVCNGPPDIFILSSTMVKPCFVGNTSLKNPFALLVTHPTDTVRGSFKYHGERIQSLLWWYYFNEIQIELEFQ